MKIGLFGKKRIFFNENLYRLPSRLLNRFAEISQRRVNPKNSINKEKKVVEKSDAKKTTNKNV